MLGETAVEREWPVENQASMPVRCGEPAARCPIDRNSRQYSPERTNRELATCNDLRMLTFLPASARESAPTQTASARRRPLGSPLTLLDRDEGRSHAGGRAVVRLGADDGADQRRDLPDAVRPWMGEEREIVVLPAGGRSSHAAGSGHRHRQRTGTGGLNRAAQVER